MQTAQVAFVVYCPCSPGVPDSDSLRVKYCTTKENNVFNIKKKKNHVKSSLGHLWVLINREIVSSLLTQTEQFSLVQMKSESSRPFLWEISRVHFFGIWIIFPFYGPNCQALFMQVIYLPILSAEELPVPALWAVNVCVGAYMASNFLPKCTARETAQSVFSNVG